MNISDELALELKGAGFPQGKIECRCVIRPCRCPENFGYQPLDLSELIDWCGDQFHSLTKTKWGFRAQSMANHDDMMENVVAPTDKEAVARLGLAIHAK